MHSAFSEAHRWTMAGEAMSVADFHLFVIVLGGMLDIDVVIILTLRTILTLLTIKRV